MSYTKKNTTHQRMQERILKRPVVFAIRQHRQYSQQSHPVLVPRHVQCVIHRQYACDGALLEISLDGVGQRSRVIDQRDRGFPFVRRQFGGKGSNLVVRHQGHQGREKFRDDLGVEFRFLEVLRVDHDPRAEAKREHPEEEDQDGVVLEKRYSTR